MTRENRRIRFNAPVPTLANPELLIDRENLRIYGTVAAMANVEALGHRLWSDMKTITMLAQLGNAARFGIRMRFGHPGFSESAMGKKVGRGTNYRVEGEKLLHDVRFFAPAEDSPVLQKPISYILGMAEQHPEEIAESVVIDIDTVWTLEDGREIPERRNEWPKDVQEKTAEESRRPEGATTPYPVMRPLTFYYDDFVAEGALTHDGLFSANPDALFIGTNQHTARIFEVMDDLRDTYGLTTEELRRKALSVLNVYETWRQGDFEMELETTGASDTQAESAPKPNIHVQQPPDLSQLASESKQLSEAADEEQYVTREEHNVVVGQLNQVVEAHNALIERFNQLVGIYQDQQSVLTKLMQDKVRHHGEPVVTQNVPLQPTTQQFGTQDPLQSIQNGTVKVPPQLQHIHGGLQSQTAKPKQPQGLGSPLRLSGNN